MQITFDRSKFLNAYATVASVVPPRTPKPILQNVRLEAKPDGDITLSATDLEIGITIKPEGVAVQSYGNALLSTTRFAPILKKSNDTAMSIETTASGIVVRGERSEFKLPSEPPDEYPLVSGEFAESKYHILTGATLNRAMRRTMFAIDTEYQKFALGSVLIELSPRQIIACGCDGRRLAVMEGEAESVGGQQAANATTLLPERAVALIVRSIEPSDTACRLAVNQNRILIATPRLTLYSRLSEGRFPRWRDVFPGLLGYETVELPVGPFALAVEQAAITSATYEDNKSTGASVQFHFGDGLLTLSAKNESGESRVELPISYSGNACRVHLNPHFVADYLRQFEPEQIVTLRINASDPDHGVVLHDSDEVYRYRLMSLVAD